MGDSATVVIVPCVSAPELSRVIPPVSRVLMMMRAESRVERSGEIGKKWSPRSVDLSKRFPPMYTVLPECGDRKKGVDQLKR